MNFIEKLIVKSCIKIAEIRTDRALKHLIKCLKRERYLNPDSKFNTLSLSETLEMIGF